MRTRAELAVALLEAAHGTLSRNLKDVTLEGALATAGGFRSVLGILKHTAAWSHVYHSYAFDGEPRHWRGTGWPRGLRDTIETSQAYFEELVAWFEASAGLWRESLAALPDEEFDAQRPCHWDATAPLFDIVAMVANHWTYHAGELNEILAVTRGEAWEYTEEVEENHVSTVGHRVKPAWMSAEQATQYEAYIADRDRELHGETNTRQRR